jgi:hypothetical protein
LKVILSLPEFGRPDHPSAMPRRFAGSVPIGRNGGKPPFPEVEAEAARIKRLNCWDFSPKFGERN